MVDIIDVQAVDMDSETYHSQPFDSLSASRLHVFRDDPGQYEEEFVTRFCARESTSAMGFGRVFHQVVLEPKRAADLATFQNGTLAVFRECPVPDRDPDMKKGKDFYWFGRNGVVRQSNDWGEIPVADGDTWAACHWVLLSPMKRNTGFCAFEDFLFDGDELKGIPSHVLSSAGSRAGDKWKAFVARYAGHELMKPKESTGGWVDVLNMRRQIRRHEEARNLLYCPNGQSEFTLVGRDAETGIQLRTRMDRFFIHDGVVWIVDLKTTRDAEPKKWQRQAIDDGLHVQAALMGILATSHFGMPFEYRYVAVDKSPRHRVVVYHFQREFLELGMKELSKSLAEFRVCVDTGSWVPADHGTSVQINVPRWMMHDDDSERDLHWTSVPEELVSEIPDKF